MSAAAATVGDAPKKKGKGLLIILIAVVVLLIVIVGGVGAYLVLGKKHGAEEAAAAKPVERKVPVFHPLDTFTVNLADPTRERYLQTNISLQIRDEKVAEELKVYNPAVRNRVLILLSSQSGEMISTPEGKDALSLALVDQINSVLGYQDGGGHGAKDSHGDEKPPVIAALFSSFVVQ
ncbi:N/A [soil metagenome]